MVSGSLIDLLLVGLASSSALLFTTIVNIYYPLNKHARSLIKKKSESKGTAAAQLCPNKHFNATQGASTVLVSMLLNFLNGRRRGSLASLIVSSLLIKVQVVKTFLKLHFKCASLTAKQSVSVNLVLQAGRTTVNCPEKLHKEKYRKRL